MPLVEQFLQKADRIKFSDDLARKNKADEEAGIARLKVELAANPNCR